MSSRSLIAVLFWMFLCAVVFFAERALAGNPFAGEHVYARYCKSCHGVKGRGVMATTPDFSWRGTVNNGLGVTDQQLAMRILQGKNTCPGFRGILSEEDIMNVITYVRTLR